MRTLILFKALLYIASQCTARLFSLALPAQCRFAICRDLHSQSKRQANCTAAYTALCVLWDRERTCLL